MDFTITDVVYMAMAVRSMLEHDLCKEDREAYEKLWMKLKLSHKGKKIKETFTCYLDRSEESVGK